MLLVATQVGNLATMLFQIVMMRSLSVVEYGILASMLSLVLITGTPLEALRTAVAHQTALLARVGNGMGIRHVLLRWGRGLTITGVMIVVLTAVLSGRMADYFQWPSPILAMLTGVIIAGSLFIPFVAGALQGMQAFVWMGIHGQVWGVTRVLTALLLLAVIGGTALAGLLAQSIAVVASVAFGVAALFMVLRPMTTGDKDATHSGREYFLWSLAVLAGYAVIMNADVALVKLFFDPDDAGTFARAATIGRSIVFLPVPIAAAMFPKVVSLGLASTADRLILFKAIGLTCALIALPALVCTLFMPVLWQLFTSEVGDAETLALARRVVWALAPLGLTFLLVNFEIAQRRFRAPAMLIGIAIAYVATVSLAHNNSLFRVVAILACAAAASLVVMLIDMGRAARRARLATPSQN